MLSLTEIAWFALASLLLALTPGPNMIYCVSRTLIQGRRAGMISLGGVLMAFLVHLFAAALGLTALLLVYAVLSWVPGASAMLLDLVSRLAEPIVRPLRRIIPLVGGIDLSPLAAIVLLQVVAIVLGNLMARVFMI